MPSSAHVVLGGPDLSKLLPSTLISRLHVVAGCHCYKQDV